MTKAIKPFKFAKTQRFRVIVNSACFYATAANIRSGVGDFTMCNEAVQSALVALENARSGTGAADQATIGLAGTWHNLNVQLNMSAK